jgi:hypothetical protein
LIITLIKSISKLKLSTLTRAGRITLQSVENVDFLAFPKWKLLYLSRLFGFVWYFSWFGTHLDSSSEPSAALKHNYAQFSSGHKDELCQPKLGTVTKRRRGEPPMATHLGQGEEGDEQVSRSRGQGKELLEYRELKCIFDCRAGRELVSREKSIADSAMDRIAISIPMGRDIVNMDRYTSRAEGEPLGNAWFSEFASERGFVNLRFYTIRHVKFTKCRRKSVIAQIRYQFAFGCC